MLPNKDRIARAARGRFFPVTVPETLTLIRKLGFSPPYYQRRIDLSFENPDSATELGLFVAGFYPADTLVICSFPEEFGHSRAKTIIEVALREFSQIDKGTRPDRSRTRVVSFRAYLGTLNQLIITRRTRKATLAKYRGGAKFSNAFKPKKVQTDECVLHSIEVT